MRLPRTRNIQITMFFRRKPSHIFKQPPPARHRHERKFISFGGFARRVEVSDGIIMSCGRNRILRDWYVDGVPRLAPAIPFNAKSVSLTI